MGWDELYAEVESGVTGVEGSTYRVKVDAVRQKATSRLLFLDLEIQAGPLAGKLAQVNLYLPKPGDRNAGYHFRRKIAGFGDLSPTFTAMAAADPDGSNIEGALTVLGTALIGRFVEAELTLRTEGEYAGTNELVLTKPIDGPAPTPVAAPTAAPAVAAPAPVASPVVGVASGGSDTVSVGTAPAAVDEPF